jgi:hypothetical protein
MKKLSFILLMLICIVGHSQSLQTEKLNFYNCEIKSDSIEKVIKSWSETTDLKVVSSESGKIKYRWTGESIYTEKKKIKPFGFYSFDMTLLFKCGKVKFTLDNFQHFSQSQYICAGGDLTSIVPNCSSDIITPEMWSEFKKNANQKSSEILTSSEEFINSKIGIPNIF